VQAGVFYLVLYQLKILELKKLKYSQKIDACLFHGLRNNKNLFQSKNPNLACDHAKYQLHRASYWCKKRG